MAEPLARLEVLRRAAESAVAEESLRGIARQIGLSAPALQNFIDGAQPRRGSTRRKLENWFVIRLAKSARREDVEAATAALHVLVRSLPAQRREAASHDLIDCLVRHHEAEANGDCPAWLLALRTVQPLD